MFIPTNCPSCDSALERVKDQLFCRNTSCEAKTAKIVEGFCKKLKIKGFGPKTIEKLDLSSISQLYTLSIETMTDALSSVKTAEKLHAEIANKLSLEFGTLVGSLGIPLIGTVAGNKLGALINSWDEVSKSSCKAAGLGDKASDSLLNWLASEQGIEVRNLPIEFTKMNAPTVSSSAASAKGDIVITGKLTDFKNRAEAGSFLETQGYSVKSGVTKKTLAVICEDGSSGSKITKANAQGTPILTIKQLLNQD